MIEKMTKSQELKVPVYLKKWLKVGYRTKSIDKKKTKAAVTFLYEDILKKEKPKYFIFLDSPMACQLAANLIKGTKLESSQLYSQLRSQLGSQLYSQLDSQLDSQLRSQLDSQLGSQKLEYFNFPINLWWWPGWTGFYDFVLNELMPEKKKEFKLYLTFLKHWEELPYYLAFDEIVFISDNPKAIRLNDQHQLHSTDKLALEYRDGWGLFMSNGITMKPDYILTPANKITKEQFLGEENADQVRELIRKIGMDRVTEILQPKVIDTLTTKTGGKYELLMINYDKRGERPYLKMKCSSSKEVFILGVKPGITKADQAWSFLNNGLDLKETNIGWEY